VARHTISVDCDGVLADGTYIPAWDRYPEVYDRLTPIVGAIDGLNALTADYNVYVVSGRSFPGALDVTREWLARHGAYLKQLAGVVVRQPRRLKAELSAMLGCELHIDDDPLVVQMAGCRGVWYESREWAGYTDLLGNVPIVRSWQDIPTFLSSYFAPRSMEQLLLPLSSAA
jgi:hypothetical protein